MLYHTSVLYSLPNNIPWIYHISSFYQLMDMWIASIWRLSSLMLLWTFVAGLIYFPLYTRSIHASGRYTLSVCIPYYRIFFSECLSSQESSYCFDKTWRFCLSTGCWESCLQRLPRETCDTGNSLSSAGMSAVNSQPEPECSRRTIAVTDAALYTQPVLKCLLKEALDIKIISDNDCRYINGVT